MAVNFKTKKKEKRNEPQFIVFEEEKQNTTNLVSVLVNLCVFQQVGMCTSATVYMQTAFIYVL